MATLQKLNPPKTNAYTVTIAYTDGIRGYTNIHNVTDPTKDTALQVLVYAKANGLELGSVISATANVHKLMELAYQLLDTKGQDAIDRETLADNLRPILADMEWLQPDGYDCITDIDITKNDEHFKLIVTDDDMRAIFRKLIH